MRPSLEWLRHTTEHSQSESPFDLVMSIDGGGNRSVYFLVQILLSGKFDELLFSELVLLWKSNWAGAFDAVGLYFCCEQREPLFHIEWHVVPVFIDACNFDLFSWLCNVHIVTQQDDFFASWDSAWEDLWRRLLDCNFLIVSVNCFLLEFLERTSGLTGNTLPVFDIFGVVGVDWLFDVSALFASVEDDFELIEDLRSDGDDSSNWNKRTIYFWWVCPDECTSTRGCNPWWGGLWLWQRLRGRCSDRTGTCWWRPCMRFCWVKARLAKVPFRPTWQSRAVRPWGDCNWRTRTACWRYTCRWFCWCRWGTNYRLDRIWGTSGTSGWCTSRFSPALSTCTACPWPPPRPRTACRPLPPPRPRRCCKSSSSSAPSSTTAPNRRPWTPPPHPPPAFCSIEPASPSRPSSEPNNPPQFTRYPLPRPRTRPITNLKQIITGITL